MDERSLGDLCVYLYGLLEEGQRGRNKAMRASEKFVGKWKVFQRRNCIFCLHIPSITYLQRPDLLFWDLYHLGRHDSRQKPQWPVPVRLHRILTSTFCYIFHTLNTIQHLKRIINVYGNTKSVPIKIPESETRFTPHHVTGKQKICKMANKRKSKSVRVMMKNELNETRQQIPQQHLWFWRLAFATVLCDSLATTTS